MTLRRKPNGDSDPAKVLIRPISPADAAAIHTIAIHPQVALNMTGLPSAEARDTESWIGESRPGLHRLVADVDGQVVGLGTLQHYTRPRLTHAGEVKIIVRPDHWRRGIGSSLARALLELADSWLNLRRLETRVFTTNPAGISLVNRFGFVSEGTRRFVAYGDDQWLDDMILARLRTPYGARNQVPEWTAETRKSQADAATTEMEIRPPRPDDLEDFYEIMSHPEVCRTTLGMPSQELALSERRLSADVPGLHRLGAVVNGKLIGLASLHQYREPRLMHAAGLGMAVLPAYWGKRIGSRLLEALIDLADNWLDLKRIELDVNVDNVAGVRLYESHGFEREGTRRMHAYGGGRMADSHFMARIRRPT